MAAVEGVSEGTTGTTVVSAPVSIVKATRRYWVEWDYDIFDAPVIRLGDIFVAEFGGKVCWPKPFRMKMAQVACEALNEQLGG